MRVGDPHVRINNLSESENLLTFVANLAKTEKVNRIELLGDQFHNHAVVRLEVVQFWERWFDQLSHICETVALEGNHDQSGDYAAGYSAMSIFKMLKKKDLFIVDWPQSITCIGYIPYTHDTDKFIQIANEMADSGVKTIVCHQTFAGSKYESGIYAPDGIPTDRISPNICHIISGHIHAQQEIGRIDYPGTARWDSAADANQSKGIWIYEHESDGRVSSKQFFSTEKVCSPLYQVSFQEGEEEPTIPENARVTLELVGSSDWITEQKLKFKGKVSFKTKIIDSAKLENRKTGNSLEDYILNIYQNTSLATSDREHLIKTMKEMGIV